MLFSELVGIRGKVISVEPDYKNFSFLQFNTGINRLSNVLCLKKGVGIINSTMEFYRDTETGGRKGSFYEKFVEGSYQGNKEIVETIKLDTLIEQYGIPDFIKIDVEGFEIEVLAGLTMNLLHTVFFVEVRAETKEMVFDYFFKKEFVCYCIDSETDFLINTASDIPNFANLLFKTQ